MTYKFFKVFIHFIYLHKLQQSWKPISVGPAVKSGTTILPQKSKCEPTYKTCITLQTSQAWTLEVYNIHTRLPEHAHTCLLHIDRKKAHGFVYCVFQGGAMAGHVACLSSMTQGKVRVTAFVLQ